MGVSLLLILTTLMAIVTSEAIAHSGGTNRYGCHAGTKPCHCHTPKEPKPPGIDLCDYTPLPTAPEEPSYYPYSNVIPDIMESKPRPSENKVTAFYNKITGSIAYGLNLIRKKPRLVKSCEEWVMVMKLMTTIAPMTPKLLATLEGKCYDAGHRRFGRYMRKRIEKLPIKLSD